MRRIRLGGAAVAACLALTLAACGGDDALDEGTQPNEQASVTVGSTNFSEQLILAQMYAAVLEKAGVNVDTRLNLGAREVVFPALEAGLGICVGCIVFGWLMRVGLVPESVCVECADITARTRRSQASPA